MSSLSLTVTPDRLRRSDLFERLTNEELLAIVGFCREKNVPEGHLLLEEGALADHLFLVEQGRLALEKKIQIGRHTTPRNATIGYVDPGKIAGFSSLSAPYTYATSAICVEPTKLIEIDGESFRNYLQANPNVGYIVMRQVAALISGRYRRATNTLTYFLSIVSHELRSPLAAIENYLNTMLAGFAGELNPKQERMIKRSALRVADLSVLISGVVDLARMRREQIQADFEWIDPGEIGTESVEDIRLAALEKNIHLRIEPPETFEPIVGARRRIRQVLTNLLGNAIKFSPPESTVNFRAFYTTEELIFEIDDEGPGIPERDKPYLFQDFFRGSNVGETQGSGLGLSIAKKIIDAHEGRIETRNLTQAGEVVGSRFRIIIPRDLETPDMKRQRWAEVDRV